MPCINKSSRAKDLKFTIVISFFLLTSLPAIANNLYIYTPPTRIYQLHNGLEVIKKEHGEIAYNRISHYVNFVKELRAKKLNEEELLNKVNQYVNGYVSENDGLVWDQDDKWLTREQFLIRGLGDCEEYAITKYFTLLDLGVSMDKIYMGMTDDLLYNQGHMVLLYYPTPKSEPLVYDNASIKVLRLTERWDLKLHYVFNHSGNYEVKNNGEIIPKKDKHKITYTKPFHDLLRAEQHNQYFK